MAADPRTVPRHRRVLLRGVPGTAVLLPVPQGPRHRLRVHHRRHVGPLPYLPRGCQASAYTESAVWSKTYIRWEIVFIICDSQKLQLRLHCEKCKYWVERKCVIEPR